MRNWNEIARTRPNLLDIAREHLVQAKKVARIEDEDNPHGVTLVISETTLMLLLASAVMAGVENQRDYAIDEGRAR
jgi:hypothetical protein